MQNADLVRVQHMRDAAQEALLFVRKRSRADLDTDRMLSLSLVRLLEIIGEAARAVSPRIRNATAAVPWTEIVGMRDRLAHGYYDVNMDIVWETVKRDLPPLVQHLRKLLSPPATHTPRRRS